LFSNRPVRREFGTLILYVSILSKFVDGLC
jgi:hypothetical protein